jgi:DNA-binding response OmpR family regulator
MSTKKVFIVEDDDDIRSLIDYILKDEQYEVHLFANVTALKKDLSGELPGLIVLDIMLPDGDGMVICEQLKTNKKTAHIPVLLMSAHRSKRDIAKYELADDFISKPFNIDHFKATVDRYLLAS